MADIVTKEKRSAMMAGIKGKNNRAEIAIRKSLHEKGFRYRLHVKNLPGKPDLVFPRYRTVVFVNGCFWHKHNCHLFKWPTTRREFWEEKINGNANRDILHITRLMQTGWKIVIIWECVMKGKQSLPLSKVVDIVIEALQFQKTTIIEIAGTS